MGGAGRVLILAGVVLLALGMVFLLLDRANFPLGRLPGDIVIQRGHSTFYFPIVTCIMVSLVLSLIGLLLRKL